MSELTWNLLEVKCLLQVAAQCRASYLKIEKVITLLYLFVCSKSDMVIQSRSTKGALKQLYILHTHAPHPWYLTHVETETTLWSFEQTALQFGGIYWPSSGELSLSDCTQFSTRPDLGYKLTEWKRDSG